MKCFCASIPKNCYRRGGKSGLLHKLVLYPLIHFVNDWLNLASDQLLDYGLAWLMMVLIIQLVLSEMFKITE